MMSQRTIGYFFWLPMFDQLNIAHSCGRPQVIHDRIRLIESLRGENVLVGDALVLVARRRSVAMEPDVMFPRDFSQFLIIRHCRILLLSVRPRNQLLTLPFRLVQEERRQSRSGIALSVRLQNSRGVPSPGSPRGED